MYRFSNGSVPKLRRERREAAQRGAELLYAVVMSAVGTAYDLPLSALEGPSRGVARVALARQIAMYLVSTLGDLDHAAVGRLFQRDRTTVTHACAIVEERRDDRDFDHVLMLIEGIVERQRQVMTDGVVEFPGAMQHVSAYGRPADGIVHARVTTAVAAAPAS
jgi:hypothetical protein